MQGNGILYMGHSDEVDEHNQQIQQIARDVHPGDHRTLLVGCLVDGVKQTHVFALGSLIIPRIPTYESDSVPHSLVRLSSSPYYPTVVNLMVDRIANANNLKQYLVNLRQITFLN